MAQSKPYQPFLFRVLHTLHGLLVIAALLTGFWVYNTYDSQFGKLPLLQIAEVESIHGTFGLLFFLVLPVFALYSFHAGQHRLISGKSIQSKSAAAPKQNQQRQVNTLMLLAAILAAISGRMMKEEWLANGTLTQQPIYYFHLSGWLVMLLCLGLHLVTTFRAGGMRLIQSTLNIRVRTSEHPKNWPAQVISWWSQPGTGLSVWWRSVLEQPAALRTIEFIVLGGIILGFIVPAFLSGE